MFKANIFYFLDFKIMKNMPVYFHTKVSTSDTPAEHIQLYPLH